ncbi:TPA: hypothetical protein DIC40_01785 [Patescibacteria group bacterium]|nr:hypothetical protein P148_SR1C00001G0299 [candidate division SR1 bacterium RAAC1_SR1_1]HCY20588.1 hypothetical protein [Candidatus Gracilibacteria bacterium]
MKRKITFFVAFFVALTFQVKSQQLDLGMSFIPAAGTVNFDMKNFEVSTTLLAHINFSTAKRYHALAYNFNGSVTTFHGWMYKDNQDVYLCLAKNIKDKEGYLGIGWEHTISNGGFSPSAFIEVGTNYAFSETYLSIGIFAPLNHTVWKKKPKE